MRGRFAPVLAGLIFALPFRARSSAAPSATAAAPAVVLDILVQDSGGHPVRGLKPANFRLTEGGVVQTLAHVEEHPSPSAAAAPAFAALPAGTFTDYTPPAPGGALNILLIDALNTPVKDLAFFRNQLLQYVTHANPKDRIAIVGLGNRPIVLQGFTSDPAVLRDVLERKLIARRSSPVAAAAVTADGSSSAIEVAANVREFESELPGMETRLRLHYSLDAFNTLAHYLAGFPGRKNLIWFSGSFPIDLAPEASPAKRVEDAEVDEDELRETVNLLVKARVAIYPVDARGVMNLPASADANVARHLHADLSKFPQAEAAERARMQALATDTGGRAFDNISNLADAVDSALAAAADFYTVTYTPANMSEDGSYRAIHIDLSGAVATQHAQLLYRQGYYGEDSTRATTSPARSSAVATTEDSRAVAYRQAAMSRGAPAPRDLLLRVRVLPASATTETSAAPDNQLALGVPTNGPFRRYDLDYLSPPDELTYTPQPNGNRRAKVEFFAYVFDTEGRLLSSTGRDVSLEATPTNFAQLMHSVIRCHLELSVPDRTETFLRIAIRDASTNKFGVIEVPASSVNSLPSASEEAAPSSGRPTPPRD
jgi:VWFA-related protein